MAGSTDSSAPPWPELPSSPAAGPPTATAASTGHSWVRLLPFVVVPAIALPIMIVSVLLDQPDPLPPDCAAAARCCLAVVNADPPVQRTPLKRCVELATRPAEQCASVLTEARATAEAADLSCDASPVRNYGSYRWTKQSTTDHTAARQRPPGKLLYPRVSCRKAAELLAEAVEQGRDGPWVAMRPLELMIFAVRLDDPNAVLYCDGFPLPATQPRQADPTQPIVFGSGPHAVLVRPERSGSVRVRQYCLGCNRVSGEPQPLGWPAD